MNKKPTTIKNNIIFDIDSATIAGGVFEFGYDKQGTCISIRELFSIRKNITNGTAYSFDEFWRRSQKIFDQVANEVHIQSLISIEEIYCNISSPWSSSQKRTVQYTKKKAFTITQELADTLIEKELSTSLSQNIDFHSYDVDIIDHKIIALRANGYPLRNPIGNLIKELEIDALVTVMSTKTKEIFEHTIEKVFHRLPKFTSNIFITYFDAQKLLPEYDDVIIMDVAGEMTEVMIIKNDHLDIIGTFPNGIYHIMRDMADILNVSVAKAHKYTHLLHSGHLDHDHHDEIESALHQAYNNWLKQLYNFCDTASKKGLLPRTIILKTYGETMPWFETLLLSSDELSEHIHAQASIQIMHLPKKTDKGLMNIDIKDSEMLAIARAVTEEKL